MPEGAIDMNIQVVMRDASEYNGILGVVIAEGVDVTRLATEKDYSGKIADACISRIFSENLIIVGDDKFVSPGQGVILNIKDIKMVRVWYGESSEVKKGKGK